MAIGDVTVDPSKMAMMRQLAGINGPQYQPANPALNGFAQRAQGLMGAAGNASTIGAGYQQLRALSQPNPSQLASSQLSQMAAEPMTTMIPSSGAPIALGPVGSTSGPFAPSLATGAGGMGGMGGAGGGIPTALGGAEGGAAAGAGGGGGLIAGGEAALGAAGGASAPALLSRAGLMRAAAGPGLGFAGTQLINAALPSTGNAGVVRHVLADASMGAGLGSTAGMLGGPLAPITAPMGALIGGGAGAIYGGLKEIFGSNKGPSGAKEQDALTSAIGSAANLTPADQQDLLATYQLMTASDNSGKGRQVALQSVLGLMNQRMQSNQQINAQTNALLASQAMAQQFMQPLSSNMVNTAQQAADYQRQLAGQLPQSMQAQAQISANNRVANANQLAGQWTNQMQLIPQMNALQMQQAQLRQASNSLLSPAISQAAAGGGGNQSLSQMLAAQGG